MIPFKSAVGPVSVYLRRFGGPIFLVVATIAAISILILDGRQLLNYNFRLNPLFVLLSVIIEFSGLILAVPAWHLIMARFGSNSSYSDDLRIYCYSILGIAIPGGIWPIVGRVALYERQGVPGIYVTIATVVEIILMGLAGLFLYGLAVLFYTEQMGWQRPEIAGLIALTVIILIQPPIFNRTIAFILRRFNYTTDQRFTWFTYADLVILLTLEVLTVFVGGTAIYVLLESVIDVPPHFYIIVIGAWALGVAASNLFFWFPGKPLIRDGAIALVMMQILSPGLAIAFVIIMRLWTIGSVMLAAGLAWLFSQATAYLPANVD